MTGTSAPQPRHVVVVPCFNEEERLPRGAFLAYAAEYPDVRLLFVDDGSTDGTRRILDELRSSSGGAIEVLALEVNQGKAEAVRRGVAHALTWQPETFGYWDADLSTPLDQIEVFARVLDERPHVHLVMGSRVKLLGSEVHRSALRHYVGRVFATFASIALDLPVYDTQCGAKLFRNNTGTRWAFRARFNSRWLFDVEILARLGRLGRLQKAYWTRVCVYEQALPVWRDVAGSKIKFLDGIKAFGELLCIGVKYRCGK